MGDAAVQSYDCCSCTGMNTYVRHRKRFGSLAMLYKFFCTPGPDKPKTCLALALDEQASLGAQVRQNLHLHSKSHEKQRIGFTPFFCASTADCDGTKTVARDKSLGLLSVAHERTASEAYGRARILTELFRNSCEGTHIHSAAWERFTGACKQSQTQAT